MRKNLKLMVATLFTVFIEIETVCFAINGYSNSIHTKQSKFTLLVSI